MLPANRQGLKRAYRRGRYPFLPGPGVDAELQARVEDTRPVIAIGAAPIGHDDCACAGAPGADDLPEARWAVDTRWDGYLVAAVPLRAPAMPVGSLSCAPDRPIANEQVAYFVTPPCEGRLRAVCARRVGCSGVGNDEDIRSFRRPRGSKGVAVDQLRG